ILNYAAGLFKLPYRLIFAVATLNSLYIYDTESAPLITVLAGLHYAAITDIAWSSNGQILALSSQDGYCTLVEFENDELGSPIASQGYFSFHFLDQSMISLCFQAKYQIRQLIKKVLR
ncbi:unnamed protein product, partial [Linum tenue]